MLVLVNHCIITLFHCWRNLSRLKCILSKKFFLRKLIQIGLFFNKIAIIWLLSLIKCTSFSIWEKCRLILLSTQIIWSNRLVGSCYNISTRHWPWCIYISQMLSKFQILTWSIGVLWRLSGTSSFATTTQGTNDITSYSSPLLLLCRFKFLLNFCSSSFCDDLFQQLHFP